MSVYSGFALRSQETNYNRALYNMLCILQLKVAKSLKGGKYLIIIEPFDDELLSKYFVKFYEKVTELEEHKHMEPLYSHAVRDLASYYNINKNESNNASFLKNTMNSEFSNHRLSPYKDSNA